MKRAVILHGKGSTHSDNWYSWLKAELEKVGWQVWVPDLPTTDQPNADRNNKFLLNQGWDWQDNLVIGHSAGSVTILPLLQALPENTKINTAILVGSFTKKLAEDPDWSALMGLFEKPFEYELIKTKAKQFIFIHSDDDPVCPIEQAKELHQKVGGEFIMIPNSQHFSISRSGMRFKKFPEILPIINQYVKQ